MMDKVVVGPALLCVLILAAGRVESQEFGGNNVCQMTKISYTAEEEYETACGLKWGWRKCKRKRYVTLYKAGSLPTCCDGWVAQFSGDKDCNLAVCFGRSKYPGTCLNGGICTAPNVCKCKPGYQAPDCLRDIDECATNNGNCSHTCVNSVGSFRCTCPMGFVRETPFLCRPKCFSENAGECANGGTCEAPNKCKCMEGFKQPDCADINECAADNPCSQVCVNMPGSYKCACHDGYQLVEDSTFPTECKPSCHGMEPLGSCMYDHTCVKPDECQCSPGYKRPKCDDADECHENSNDCTQICINNIGSFECSCGDGYQLLNDGKTCIATCFGEPAGTCQNGGTCILPGTCLCPDGFRSPDCEDINECDLSPCPALCENSQGSFRCHCYEGYVQAEDDTCLALCDESLPAGECLNGGKCLSPGVCDCPKGYEEELCRDTNECNQDNGGCSDICVNEEGSFHCECPPGYTLDDERTCGDYNECQDENSCDSYCVNMYGSYTCQCPSGFEMTSDKKCRDIDECKESVCGQHCKNTPGSFQCSCDENFTPTPDGRGCKEVKLCSAEDDPESGCAPLCVGRYPCLCPEGTHLHTNGKNCIDPCVVLPCKHNGICIANWDEGYRCNCYAAGYTGEHCEIGVISMPSSLNARVGVIYPNINIQAKPMQELVFELAGKDDTVKIFPSPVIVRSPSRFSALFNKRGVYDLTFKVTGQSADVFDDTKTVQVVANDVFSRLKLYHSALPTGCFWHLLKFEEHKLWFSSTSPWYQLKSAAITYTSGIVMLVHSELHLPISSDGVEIKAAHKVILSSIQASKEDGTQLPNDKDVSCEELFLSETDMKEFREARSIFWSLFKNLEEILPYWIQMYPSGQIKKDAIPFKPEILSGSEVQQQAVCTGAPTTDEILYLVFRFKDPFTMRILEESFDFPESDCCIIVDMLRSVGPTVTFMFTEEAAAPFRYMDMFKTMQEYGYLTVFYTGFSISLPGEINVHDAGENMVVWNGANTFLYPFDKKATVWSTMVLKKDYIDNYDAFDFKLEATIEAYMSNIDPHSLFTHLFVDPRNVLLRMVKTSVAFGLRLFGQHHSIKMLPILEERRAIVAIGGDGHREYCGNTANPPGIFLRVSLDKKLLEGYPILEDFILSAQNEMFFFKTFPEGSDKGVMTEDWAENTTVALNALQDVVRVLKSAVDKANTSKLKTDDLVPMVKSLQESLSDLSDHIDSVSLDNFTALGFSDFTKTGTEYVARIHKTYLELADRLSVSLDNSLDDMFTTFSEHISSLRYRSSVIVWQLYTATIPLFPNSGTMGFKGTFGLTILGMQFGFEGELVLTDEALFKCSTRFSKFYDHLNGEKAVRFLGVVSWQTPSLKTLTDWGPLFWKYLTPKIGFGIELAFSTERVKFVARLHVRWSLLGFAVTGDLFVTNNGVFASAEANMFDMYRIRLTVGAEVGLKPQDWGIWLQGDFIPGGDDSFEGSLWEAVRQAVKRFGENAIDRLKKAEYCLQIAQQKLSAAQIKMEAAKQKLLRKQYLFDEAIAKLENAKKRLEEKKAPFLAAKAELTALQQKLEKMCQIQTCSRTCMPGIKRWKISRCAFTIPNLKCAFLNAICRLKRGLVFAALEIAKIFLHIPLLALDLAKGVVSAAQIVVDKSRWLLNVAAAFHDAGKLLLRGVEWTAGLAQKALAGMRLALGAALDMFDAFVKNVLQKFIDIKKCGFKNTLSVAVGWEIEIYCEVNFLDQGWVRHYFVINFRNIIGSLWKQAKNLVQKAFAGIGRRRKRGAEYTALSSFHKIFRRGAANQVYNESAERFEFNSDSFWVDLCKNYTSSIEFVKKSLSVLIDISNTIGQAVSDLESNSTSFHSGIDIQQELNSAKAEQIHADDIYGEFNLTREQVDKAIKETDFYNDDEIKELNATMSDIRRSDKEGVESMKEADIIQMWISEMENRTTDMLRDTADCQTFGDCLVYAFGDLYSLLDAVDPKLVYTHLTSLPDLEGKVYDLLDNSTRSAEELSENAENILRRLQAFDADNILCGTLPVFTESPNSTEVLQGATVVLSCTAQGVPAPNYHWMKDELVISGAKTDSIKLRNVTSGDEGLYICVAENHVGNASSLSARIDVMYPPKVQTSFPDVLDVLVGDNKTLTCNVTAKPTGRIAWYSSDSVHPISQESVLVMQNKLRASTLLKCVANNTHGIAESNEFQLRVRSASPANPVVHLQLGYFQRPLHNKTYSLLGDAAIGLSLVNRFHFVVQLIMINASNHVQIIVSSVDPTTKTLNISASYKAKDVSFCYREKCRQHYSQMSSDVIQSLKAFLKVVDAEPVLFFTDEQAVYFNPASVKLHGETHICQVGVQAEEPSICADMPELTLDPPSELQHRTQNGKHVFEWKAPVYGTFVTKYKLEIMDKSDDSVTTFDTQTAESSMTLEESIQPGEYEARISAYTQHHSSPAANMSFQVGESGSPEALTDPSTAGVVAGVSVTVGVIAVAVTVVSVVLFTTKGQKKTGSIASLASTMSTSTGGLSPEPSAPPELPAQQPVGKSLEAWQPVVAGDKFPRSRPTTSESTDL